MSIPAELKYTKDHEWVRMDGDIAIGVGFKVEVVEILLTSHNNLNRPAANLAKEVGWRVCNQETRTFSTMCITRENIK